MNSEARTSWYLLGSSGSAEPLQNWHFRVPVAQTDLQMMSLGYVQCYQSCLRWGIGSKRALAASCLQHYFRVLFIEHSDFKEIRR